MAVWLVRDCGLFTYQVTANFGAGCYAPKTTETLINYTACCMLVFIIQSQSVTSFYKSNILSYQSTLTLIRSTNLFCFLWAGKPQTALKGGTRAGIC